MTSPPKSRQQFLANLEKSGLLTPGAFQQATAVSPTAERARELAMALVRAGTLTRFQADLLLAGKTRGFVIGQYTLLRQRGKGGLGRVYKAVHKTMNRVVALKVLSPRLIKTDKARELFQREVVAVSRLVHPNIVTAYDANMSGDRHYLVMEYVAGPDLERLVQHHGPVRAVVASEIIRQAALGLQYAWEMGMLHRDIKPANILIQSTKGALSGPWTVKLVDFGLARLQATESQPEGGMGTILTKENTVMGTPDYLSPEQSRDLHEVDIRSDLYSLGCTFHFILTGQVPFPGGSPLDKMIRHATEAPTPVEQIRADIPAEVSKIVRRLLEKNPDDRFQMPADLATALRALSSPTSTAAPKRQSSSERRNPSLGRATKDSGRETTAPGAHAPNTAATASLPKETIATSSSFRSARGPCLTEPKKASAVDAGGRKSIYGLYIALGMVLLIVVIAVFLSLLRSP